MLELDEDLQRILQSGAKLYCVTTERQGRVLSVSDQDVIVNYGTENLKKLETYNLDDFKESLTSDLIVANYRLIIGNGNKFKVRPRSNVVPVTKPATPTVESIQSAEDKPPVSNLEVGYINERTGKFSKESKRGYVKIEYKKLTEKVTLELTSEQLDKLKQMGLV